jgi:hypothetical protein
VPSASPTIWTKVTNFRASVGQKETRTYMYGTKTWGYWRSIRREKHSFRSPILQSGKFKQQTTFKLRSYKPKRFTCSCASILWSKKLILHVIVTVHGLDKPRFEPRQRHETFLVQKHLDNLWDPHSLTFKRQHDSFRHVHNSPPSSAEVKETGAMPLRPSHAFMASAGTSPFYFLCGFWIPCLLDPEFMFVLIRLSLH